MVHCTKKIDDRGIAVNLFTVGGVKLKSKQFLPNSHTREGSLSEERGRVGRMVMCYVEFPMRYLF